MREAHFKDWESTRLTEKRKAGGGPGLSGGKREFKDPRAAMWAAWGSPEMASPKMLRNDTA